MIKASVNVQKDWGGELIQRANRIAKDAVADASESGARTASSIAGRRSRTGTMAEMELLEVVGTGSGWTGGFRSKAWYAGFQSRGTRKGIKPLGFLEAGAKEAKAELKRELERRMRVESR